MADKPEGAATTTHITGREVIIDGLDVPSSLVYEIAPILAVAKEIQSKNPRVSYLCRFHAFERAHKLDPRSSGRGVREFKTALIQRLKTEDKTTSPPGKNSYSDEYEIQSFYLMYYKTYIDGLRHKVDCTRYIKFYQTAAVLFEVLETIAHFVEVPDELLEANKIVTENVNMYTHNIYPPEAVGSRYPEILEAHTQAAEKTETHTHNILYPESSDQVLIRRGKMKQPKHHKIPLQVIKDCTGDFNESNFIGKGGYGRVYKGILTWADYVNEVVAVKRLDFNGFQGNKEFHTEVSMLSEYQHENIITLIGFCDDNKEMILVYEYASNGSLDTYLRDTTLSGGLSWTQLLNICIGVASALDYLHNHVAEKHRIIHRDIKSANVLLDENWNAKLSDFGLARIGLANQQNTIVITNIAGTHGYNDPQYERTGLLSKESDVYLFGVVLFEVLCGRLACVCSFHDERRFLHHLARTRYKNGELETIVDNRIKKDIKQRTFTMFSAIAYQCIQETREDRPTIAEVAFQLKEARKIQVEDEENHELFSQWIHRRNP
ncbi:hypothetical protein L2E82_29990 [Cichorium intybus]|uniref:Uncharacterized protein n=1 Tax=Cichorium intybus TaxID=13427 RepID=A0ACB9CZE0_CICIN|nr:hypothetical protein L2E82_29990 [Cichorium intybus]